MLPHQALILGLVQGLSEFLPVSSSGHLVLIQRLWGLREPALLFDITLHLGTLVAVAIFVRREIKGLVLAAIKAPWLSLGALGQAWRQEVFFRLLVLIVVASIPTAVIGYAFKDVFTALFASPRAVGWALVATGLVLAATRLKRPGPKGPGELGWLGAAAIGAAQGLAIIPGLSRSGATIAAGLFVGLERQSAARFSFLLSLPAIVGALALELTEARTMNVGLAPALIGFLAAAGSGYLALVALMRIVLQGRFHFFAPYCGLVGLLTLLTMD